VSAIAVGVKSALRVIGNVAMIAREFDEPLRSMLIGLAVSRTDLDLKRLRLLKPCDAPFRDQCLALIIGVPGFNVEKAVELSPLAEPLRTQALTLLAATPGLDVQSVFALCRFDEPFRSQCVAWLIKDPTLDVAKLRLLEPCPEPVRQQAVAMIAAHPTLDVDPKRLEAFTHCRPEVPGHADVFFRDLLGGAERVRDDDVHLRAALDWLLHCRAVTGSDGFAAAYSFREGWLPADPETTGHVIPTLFKAHAVLGDARLCQAAAAAAAWVFGMQGPNGVIEAAYRGSDLQRFVNDDPAAADFETGQIVLGWNHAFQQTGNKRFLEASVRACRFLADRGDNGGEMLPGPSHSTHRTGALFTSVGYAMAWTGRLTGEPAFEAAARRHLDSVLAELQPDGWVLHAGFEGDSAPLTQMMAHTAEGLLDAGELLEDDRYIDASRRHVVAAANACERRGMFLPAHFTSGWKSTDRYCCLPGNAHFAKLWCRHGRRAGDLTLINTGLKMVDWLKQRQALDNDEPGIRGGLPGAWPIDGGYPVYSYVNRAAKYFVDALLEARAARQELRVLSDE
jgi:hypothetical protein